MVSFLFFGTNVNTGQSKVINQTVFAAGRNIDINSVVNGDVICAGQTINISGVINGDVICAGQTINVSGKITGDIRLAGQTVNVSADVAGSATIGGQSFTLDSNAKIGRDLSVGATDAVLNGQVGRDVASGATNLTIAGTIGRNVQASVEHLTVASSADVKGNIDYTSVNDLDKQAGAKVGGKVSRSEPKNVAKSKNYAVFGIGFVWFLYWLLAMLLTAIALVLLFPRVFVNVTNKAMPKPWKALLTGLIANILAPLVLIVLAITVVGIPLAIILGLIWILALMLSGPFFGYYIGRLIMPKSKHAVLTMLVGAGLLLIAYFIPLVGLLALAVAIWVGTGMLLLDLFGRTPKPEYAVTPPNKRKHK